MLFVCFRSSGGQIWGIWTLQYALRRPVSENVFPLGLLPHERWKSAKLQTLQVRQKFPPLPNSRTKTWGCTLPTFPTLLSIDSQAKPEELTLPLPGFESTFSKPFKDKYTSEVVTIGSTLIIFHLSSSYCVMAFSGETAGGNLKIITLGSERVLKFHFPSSCFLENLV